MLLTVCVGALGALEPLVIKGIVDTLIGKLPRTDLAWAAAPLLGLYVAREILTGTGNWLTWRTRLDVQQRILDATVGRLHTLSLAYHRTQPVGALLTQLDRGVQGLVVAFSDLAFNVVPTLVFLALSVYLMARLQWQLTVGLVVLVPVPALIGALAAPAQTLRERTLLERWVRIYARFNEVLSGIITVKSFAMEHEEKRRFIRNVREANGVVIKGVGFDARVSAGQGLAAGLTKVGLMAYGALLVTQGQITVGTLFAFWGYIGGLFGPVQSLTTIYQSAQRARVAMDTVFSILDSSDHVADGPEARDVAKLQGDVEFNDVSFGYRPGQRVLRQVNLRLQRGSTVALVGPSGGGKTTLAILLQRLYEPTHGVVTIDGIDLRKIKQDALRRQIGVVLQDAWLFNDSVLANIAYGRPEATRSEIEAAARAANAHEFICALERGYDTEVGERGNLLSAGQRQRIAIARALLKDPPIVLLDEATSALDAESEAVVQEALDRLLANRTTLVIAHRLATVVRADQICVLRNGSIVEQGTHHELLARGGDYASLVALQTRGLAHDLSPRAPHAEQEESQDEPLVAHASARACP